MIIIKTSNGDSFINEKETQIVQHDKANKQVIIRSSKEGLNCIIHNVEGLLYTNDAQPTSWKDEGSELQRAIKICESRQERLLRWRVCYDNIKGDFSGFVNDIIRIVDKYKIADDVKKRLRDRAEELKSKILADEYIEYIKRQFHEHQTTP